MIIDEHAREGGSPLRALRRRVGEKRVHNTQKIGAAADQLVAAFLERERRERVFAVRLRCTIHFGC